MNLIEDDRITMSTDRVMLLNRITEKNCRLRLNIRISRPLDLIRVK